jgi:AraC-like DNA-binding protein
MIQAGLSYNHPIYNGKHNDAQEEMKKELMTIVRNPDKLPLINIGHLYLFIGGLINSSSTQRSVVGGGVHGFYVNEAVRFIEQHYQENIDVADIAASCGINRSYLSKIFRPKLEINTHDFLIRYRINKSCELLKVTDLSIGEISFMVGYPNQFTFSRIFKTAQGKSPREWRNGNKIQGSSAPF